MKSIVKIVFTTVLSCCLITTIPVIAAPKTDVITGTVVEITSIKSPKQQLEAIIKLRENGKSNAFILTVLLKLPVDVIERLIIASYDMYFCEPQLNPNKLKQFCKKIKNLEAVSNKKFEDEKFEELLTKNYISDEVCIKEFGVDYITMTKNAAAFTITNLGVKLLIEAIKSRPLISIEYDEIDDKCIINSSELKKILMHFFDLYQINSAFSPKFKASVIDISKEIEKNFPKKNVKVDLFEFVYLVIAFAGL